MNDTAFRRQPMNRNDVAGSVAALEAEVARTFRGVAEAVRARVDVRTSSTTAQNGDVIDFETLSTAVKVYLPAGPGSGARVFVKAPPNAATFSVTIDGNGKTIDGSATLVLSTNNQAERLWFNGKQWRRL